LRDVGGRVRAAAALGAVLLVAAGCPAQQPAGRPNVLLVSIDTLRADHLEAYGYGRSTSPTLSDLAREGARFERAYAQASSTVPSHASLFTGRYPFQHGTYTYRTPLPAAELTLAELLRQHGFVTFALTSSVRFVRESGFDQGFASYRTFHELDKNERSQRVTEAALEAMDAAGGRPFFGFLHYFDPHAPYSPPEAFASLWHPGEDPFPAQESQRFIQSHRRPGQAVPPETLAYLEALYDASIRYLDGPLARLLEGISERGLAADTLVVVTSDHGDEFKEHGGLSHDGPLHEEVVRVPLLVRWPGRVPAGLVIERAVQGVDVLPTILDLLGLEVPGPLQGRSQAELLRGETPAALEPELLLLQHRPKRWAVYARLPAGLFKLSVEGEDRVLLRLDGPTGGADARSAHPEVESILRNRAATLGVHDAPQRAPSGAPVSEDVRERLRAIGYADEVDAN
jgi:arylsulfatase A-like enzyme